MEAPNVTSAAYVNMTLIKYYTFFLELIVLYSGTIINVQ